MIPRRLLAVDHGLLRRYSALLAILGTSLLVFVGAFLVPACATLGNGQLDVPSDATALVISEVASVAVPALLRKHPEHRPAIVALQGAIDRLFIEGGDIDPSRLKAFTGALAKQYQIDEESEAVIAQLLMRAHRVYRHLHPGEGPISASDPAAQAFLRQLRDAIADGVAFHDAFRPAPAPDA